MEDEAYVQSFYMAWIFFPIFIVIAVVQGLLIELYNKKYHPFIIILEDVTKKGKMFFTCSINANQRCALWCLIKFRWRTVPEIDKTSWSK